MVPLTMAQSLSSSKCLHEFFVKPIPVSSGFRDLELTNAADSSDLPYRQLETREINHWGISP